MGLPQKFTFLQQARFYGKSSPFLTSISLTTTPRRIAYDRHLQSWNSSKPN